MNKTITSPKTQREITVGGPTYNALMKSPYWREKLLKKQTKKKVSFDEKSIRHTHNTTASSSKKNEWCVHKTKYMNSGIPKDEFCGSAGGACPYTYPVDTKERYRAALAYSRYAPDPEGVKECARSIAKRKNWI